MSEIVGLGNCYENGATVKPGEGGKQSALQLWKGQAACLFSLQWAASTRRIRLALSLRPS